MNIQNSRQTFIKWGDQMEITEKSNYFFGKAKKDEDDVNI
jgi:hypothetical protein